MPISLVNIFVCMNTYPSKRRLTGNCTGEEGLEKAGKVRKEKTVNVREEGLKKAENVRDENIGKVRLEKVCNVREKGRHLMVRNCLLSPLREQSRNKEKENIWPLKRKYEKSVY